eukprot:447870_1
MADPNCNLCKMYQKEAKWKDKKCNDCEERSQITSEPENKLGKKKFAKTVGIMVIAGVATVGLATIALPAVGFTAGGVAAGSIAASIQSSIGTVAAGSIFATLQSAGAAGLSVGAQAVIGGIGAVSAGLLSTIKGKQTDIDSDDSVTQQNDDDRKDDDRKDNNKKQNMAINTDRYEEWNTEQLINWILSIDEDIFQQYEQTLRKSLTEEQVDGSCLN